MKVLSKEKTPYKVGSFPMTLFDLNQVGKIVFTKAVQFRTLAQCADVISALKL